MPSNRELQDLVQALKEAGMNIPDEVKDTASLIIAIKANPPIGGGGGDGFDALDNPQTIAMSTTRFGRRRRHQRPQNTADKVNGMVMTILDGSAKPKA